MKKFLAALLALALLLGTTACGSAESTSGESAGEESISEAATASGTEEEPTTLVYGSSDYTRINRPWTSTARSTSCCSTA